MSISTPGLGLILSLCFETDGYYYNKKVANYFSSRRQKQLTTGIMCWLKSIPVSVKGERKSHFPLSQLAYVHHSEYIDLGLTTAVVHLGPKYDSLTSWFCFWYESAVRSPSLFADSFSILLLFFISYSLISSVVLFFSSTREFVSMKQYFGGNQTAIQFSLNSNSSSASETSELSFCFFPPVFHNVHSWSGTGSFLPNYFFFSQKFNLKACFTHEMYLLYLDFDTAAAL